MKLVNELDITGVSISIADDFIDFDTGEVDLALATVDVAAATADELDDFLELEWDLGNDDTDLSEDNSDSVAVGNFGELELELDEDGVDIKCVKLLAVFGELDVVSGRFVYKGVDRGKLEWVDFLFLVEFLATLDVVSGCLDPDRLGAGIITSSVICISVLSSWLWNKTSVVSKMSLDTGWVPLLKDPIDSGDDDGDDDIWEPEKISIF